MGRGKGEGKRGKEGQRRGGEELKGKGQERRLEVKKAGRREEMKCMLKGKDWKGKERKGKERKGKGIEDGSLEGEEGGGGNELRGVGLEEGDG